MFQRYLAGVVSDKGRQERRAVFSDRLFCERLRGNSEESRPGSRWTNRCRATKYWSRHRPLSNFQSSC